MPKTSPRITHQDEFWSPITHQDACPPITHQDLWWLGPEYIDCNPLYFFTINVCTII
jgi:hypothetical protein